MVLAALTVGQVTHRLYELWGADFAWQLDTDPGPPESTFLKLDASKARAYLGWKPMLDLDTTLAWIVEWFQGFRDGADPRDACLSDIHRFMALER